jgi:hypothetical protein
MTLLAEITVTALLGPLAITPTSPLVWANAQPPEAMQPAAVAPAAMAPVAVTPAPVASTTVVAPTGSTVVVSDGSPSVNLGAPLSGWETSTTTTTTTTTTATTTVPRTTVPATTGAAAPMSPKAAVNTLLRYDPYLAPRYRSGRNMMIGGGVSLGVGTFTLLSTLGWLSLSAEAVDEASDPAERRRIAAERNKWLPTARIVGLVAAGVVVTGIVLLAAGGVKRRRAIEEARGRVYMQAGPGGLQVRF